MRNPWEEISLTDYESHMALPSVFQLQTLSRMMDGQLNDYPVSTVMILGVAGGNGLEHIRLERGQTVYGVDINAAYLETCRERFRNLGDRFHPIRADLTDPSLRLPHAELVVADLLVEYIGTACFAENIRQIGPQYVSAVIQINTGDGFVSDSPYLRTFDGLERVHRQMEERELTRSMEGVGYKLLCSKEKNCPTERSWFAWTMGVPQIDKSLPDLYTAFNRTGSVRVWN